MTQPMPETPSPEPSADVIHELDAIRIGGVAVRVRLETRRAPDGTWRGRMRFLPEASLLSFVTGDIFRGSADADLLVAGRSLREHHLRDLYRSLQGDAA